MKPLKGKAPSESKVTMTELVLPSHTNALGTIFGGTVLAWIDIAAATAAMRHARQTVVTASIDALHFIAPIRLGQIVHIQANVNYASRTSLEVGVRVDSEDPKTGERTHNVSAYTTFVALNEQYKPTPVPPVIPTTPIEKRRFKEAEQRRKARIELAEEIRIQREQNP